jgi:hypothetical protein
MDLIFLMHSFLVLIRFFHNQLKVLLMMAILTNWMGILWQALILHKRRRVSRWSLEHGQVHLIMDWLILIHLTILNFELLIVVLLLYNAHKDIRNKKMRKNIYGNKESKRVYKAFIITKDKWCWGGDHCRSRDILLWIVIVVNFSSFREQINVSLAFFHKDIQVFF